MGTDKGFSSFLLLHLNYTRQSVLSCYCAIDANKEMFPIKKFTRTAFLILALTAALSSASPALDGGGLPPDRTQVVSYP